MTFKIRQGDQFFIAEHTKHARDEAQALSYLLKTKSSKTNKFVVFKKGAVGELISIEKIDHVF